MRYTYGIWIFSSLKKHDLTTLNNGLNKMVAIIDPLLLSENVNHEQLLFYILNIFRRISLITLYYNDEDSVNQIVTRISDKGELASKEKLENVTEEAIEILGEVGRISASQFQYSTVKIAKSIENICISDIKLNIGKAAPIHFLGTMGKVAAENKLEYVTNEIISNIHLISKGATDQKLKKPILMSLYSLRTIGKAALEQDLDQISKVIDSMREIGVSSSQSYPYATNMSIYTLDDLKKIAFDDENENVIVQITLSIKEIIISLAKQKNEATIINGLISLENTVKLSNEKNLINSLSSVKQTLEELETILKDNKLIEAADHISKIKKQIE